MPAPLVSYIRGLLQGLKPTATALSRQFGYSHDQLTRFLASAVSWRRWYRFLILHLFGRLSDGWLIIDDTVLAKPFGRLFASASWVYDSSAEKTVFGYNIIMVCWSNGVVTLPLCWRWYQKGGKTKIDLSLELLAEVFSWWRVKPSYLLMDAFYVAGQLINQLEDYGWKWVGRIKKNRIINCCPIQEDLVEERSSLIGPLTGRAKVKVIRHGDRFLATNDLALPNRDIPYWYQKRWSIEECFRFLKQQLHLSGCQARSTTAQQKHLLTCCVAALIVEKEKTTSQKTGYAIKERFMLDRVWGNNRIRHYQPLLLSA